MTVPHGSIIDKAVVVRRVVCGGGGGGGVVLSMPAPHETTRSFCPQRNLEDGKTSRATLEKGKYAPGTTHTCRVVGADPMAGYVSVTMQPSVLALPFIQYSDVTP